MIKQISKLKLCNFEGKTYLLKRTFSGKAENIFHKKIKNNYEL